MEQGPPAGRTVGKVSQCQSQKDATNDKKIKGLLNEHIRKRPHSLGNPAGLVSNQSWARLQPEFARLGRDLLFGPACFIPSSSRGHQCTRPEIVNQIQRSEACFYILSITHLYL